MEIFCTNDTREREKKKNTSCNGRRRRKLKLLLLVLLVRVVMYTVTVVTFSFFKKRDSNVTTARGNLFPRAFRFFICTPRNSTGY